MTTYEAVQFSEVDILLLFLSAIPNCLICRNLTPLTDILSVVLRETDENKEFCRTYSTV